MSNDNAHVELLFRTLKYVPSWPEKGFATLEEARCWVETFVGWYNEEHRHSGIRYVTPGQRHRGEDSKLLAERKSVYEVAKMRDPYRWSGAIRNWNRQDEVWLNPERKSRLYESNLGDNYLDTRRAQNASERFWSVLAGKTVCVGFKPQNHAEAVLVVRLRRHYGKCY